MKNNILFIGLIILAGALGACGVMFGPDKPAGDTRLVIRVGEGARSTVPIDVINALYYKLVLTGPSGDTLERRISPGEGQLAEPVTLGTWEIWAGAYTNEDVLAGEGNATVKVIEGANSVTIPMNVNGGYFAVTIGTNNTSGTVESNHLNAFPGTKIALTVTPYEGYVLKARSLTATDGTATGIPPGSSTATNGIPIEGEPSNDGDGPRVFSFIMPSADVTITAEFEWPFRENLIDQNGEITAVVTVLHSNGSVASTEISESKGDTLTFTVSGSAYPVDARNLWWSIDSTQISSSSPNDPARVEGSSLVISAGSYPFTFTGSASDNHQVDVMIMDLTTNSQSLATVYFEVKS